jgi:5'(3')-deoxyribonucleotidase
MDMDGTVLDFNGRVKSYLADRGIPFNPDECFTYDYSCYGKEIADKIKHEVMRDIEFYEKLGYFEGAYEAIQRLSNHVTIQAYTGSVNVPEIFEKRQSLCKSLGFVADGVYIDGKKPVFLEADALFDDNIDVFKQWIGKNKQAKLYLIDAPYNQQDDNDDVWNHVIRCKNLSEAVDLYIGGLEK